MTGVFTFPDSRSAAFVSVESPYIINGRRHTISNREAVAQIPTAKQHHHHRTRQYADADRRRYDISIVTLMAYATFFSSVSPTPGHRWMQSSEQSPPTWLKPRQSVYWKMVTAFEENIPNSAVAAITYLFLLYFTIIFK